jgi:hypothetical protein
MSYPQDEINCMVRRTMQGANNFGRRTSRTLVSVTNRAAQNESQLLIRPSRPRQDTLAENGDLGFSQVERHEDTVRVAHIVGERRALHEAMARIECPRWQEIIP